MQPRRTALHDVHVQHGARMVEFAGHLMPVQYRGIKEEHLAVRESVGLFDVSHMGEFFFHGERAADFLQNMTLNDIGRLQKGRAQYTAICSEDGGLLDDLIVYDFGESYMAIVNASNRKKDYEWFKQHLQPGVELHDRSDDMSLFAVQGRNAEAIVQKLTDTDLSQVDFYWFTQGELAGVRTFMARTGYTGEDGFEIGVENSKAVRIWQTILAEGAEFGIEPVGLGARDTLRIEMKYCLYGNDIDETTNPIEAGLDWITKTEKGPFIGRQAISRIKEKGPRRKLVGFEVLQRGIPRHGYKLERQGAEVGQVTSGTFSPSLGKGIGMAYVETPFYEVGSELEMLVRGKGIAVRVVKTPFYQRPY